MAASQPRMAYPRRGIGSINEVRELGWQLQQAELLQVVGHGEGHAALVLLCCHGCCRRSGMLAAGVVLEREGGFEAASRGSRNVFVCGVADLRPGHLTRSRRDLLQGCQQQAKNTRHLAQFPGASISLSHLSHVERTRAAACALGRSQLTSSRVGLLHRRPSSLLLFLRLPCLPAAAPPNSPQQHAPVLPLPPPWLHNTTPKPHFARYRGRAMPLELPFFP